MKAFLLIFFVYTLRVVSLVGGGVGTKRLEAFKLSIGEDHHSFTKKIALKSLRKKKRMAGIFPVWIVQSVQWAYFCP